MGLDCLDVIHFLLIITSPTSATSGTTHTGGTSLAAGAGRTSAHPARSTTEGTLVRAAWRIRNLPIAKHDLPPLRLDPLSPLVVGLTPSITRLFSATASVHRARLFPPTSLTLVLPRVGLSCARGISASRPTVFICGRPVRVGCAAPMLRIVLPVIASSTSGPL